MSSHFKKLYEDFLENDKLETIYEVMVYTIIYSYPQHIFQGQQKILAKWCKCKDTKTIRKALKNLQKKGLLEIKKKGGHYNAYRYYKIITDLVTYT